MPPPATNGPRSTPCAAALAVVLAAATLGALGCGREAPHQVRIGIEQIASIAAEGALMADDVARARTKTTFVRVHGEELSAQAEHEAEKLSDDPVAPGLEGRVRVAIELAAQIGGAIDQLRVSPHDRSTARQDAAKLRRWADQAGKVAQSI